MYVLELLVCVIALLSSVKHGSKGFKDSSFFLITFGDVVELLHHLLTLKLAHLSSALNDFVTSTLLKDSMHQRGEKDKQVDWC